MRYYIVLKGKIKPYIIYACTSEEEAKEWIKKQENKFDMFDVEVIHESLEKAIEQKIKRVMHESYESYEDEYEHKVSRESVQYGDTWVETNAEPTEKSIEQCREDFKYAFDSHYFTREGLAEDAEFLYLMDILVRKEI